MPLFTCSNCGQISQLPCVVPGSVSWWCVPPAGRDTRFHPARGQSRGGFAFSWSLQCWWGLLPSLCKGMLVLLCVRGLLSRLLSLWHSPGASSAPAPVWLASRERNTVTGSTSEATEGWEQGCTCLFCGPYGSSVSKKDQISSKTIRNYSTVSQLCICVCYLHFCLVNNLQ